MSDSPRLVLRVAGLAVTLGLAALAGPAVASADDGTGAPAPGPSSAGPTSDDGAAPPLKAPPPMRTMDVGNGRVPGTKDPLPSKTAVGNGRNLGQFDGGGGPGIGSVSPESAAGFKAQSDQAAADEAQDMAELLSVGPGKQGQEDMVSEMQDFAAQVNSLTGATADNPPQRRSEYPG